MAEDQDKNYGPEVTKQLSMKHKQGTLLCARKEDSVRAEWLNLLPFSSEWQNHQQIAADVADTNTHCL